MKRICLLMLSVTLFASCTDNNLPAHDFEGPDVFEVTTVGIDIDCGYMVLQFKDEDLDRLVELVGTTHIRPSQRQALNLDRNRFGETDLRISVRIRKTLESEAIICTAYQVPPKTVYVISAGMMD